MTGVKLYVKLLPIGLCKVSIFLWGGGRRFYEINKIQISNTILFKVKKLKVNRYNTH